MKLLFCKVLIWEINCKKRYPQLLYCLTSAWSVVEWAWSLGEWAWSVCELHGL